MRVGPHPHALDALRATPFGLAAPFGAAGESAFKRDAVSSNRPEAGLALGGGGPKRKLTMQTPPNHQLTFESAAAGFGAGSRSVTTSIASITSAAASTSSPPL